MKLPEKNSRGYVNLPDGGKLPYLMLGRGQTPVVIIPGAGDGLTNVVEGAFNLGLYYLRRSARYRILLLSRRLAIPEGFSMEQHAGDMICALKTLRWPSSVLELNSAGGPVGQWIAFKEPELVRGMILSVTLHRTPASTQTVLEHWIALARQSRWRELNWSSIEMTFRPETVSRYRMARPFLGLLKPPSDPNRLPRILAGLIGLDQSALLPKITCPCLVIGGEADRVIPAGIQREMASLLPDSRLILYPGFGHGNDQENPAYEREAQRFIDNPG